MRRRRAATSHTVPVLATDLREPHFDDWVDPDGDDRGLSHGALVTVATARWQNEIGNWFRDWSAALASVEQHHIEPEVVARRDEVGPIVVDEQRLLGQWAREVSVGSIRPFDGPAPAPVQEWF